MSNQVEIVYSQATPTTVEVVVPGPQGPPGAAGPAGAAGVGSAWLQGSGAPAAGLGANGDYYLNTSNGDIYGPKGSSGWGAVVFNIAEGRQGLAGPAGPAGPPGAMGPQGPAGPAGAQGLQGPAGPAGQSGREVQLQVGATHIQWRYVGDPAWADLVALSVITGPTGPVGATGPQGPAGAEGPSGVANATAPITYDVGTKTIAIAAATTAAAGSMSAADKAKLDGLATVATSGAYADLSGRPTLGTAAALNTGTSAGSVVALDGSGRLPAVDGSQLTGLPPGGVTSIGLTAPTGFSVSGSPITTNGLITLAFATGYSLPTDAKQSNWDTAHAERLRWDGGATGLDATTARTSLGLGTAATTDATAYATAAQGALAATAIQPSDSRLTDAREWSAATIDQAEAEAGTSTTRRAFTAQRVFQAIAAWWNTSAAKTKLDGIATGATANSTDGQLRDRATHTGTQAASTITGLAAVATSGSASDLSTGTLAAARLPTTTVTPGSYSNASITVDGSGRITAASNGTSAGVDPVIASMIF